MFDRIAKGLYWDKPWTLVSGCTRCSPGCEHCWALAMEKRFSRQPKESRCDRLTEKFVGKKVFGNIRIHTERLDIPLRRKKPTVWAVWNDLFHEDVPDEFIMRVFDSMPTDLLQPCKHIYLILTKRIKRMHQFFDERTRYGTRPWTNVWLGVTVCNQAEADAKIPFLLQIPAAVRWVSIEPMLGPVDISLYFRQRCNAKRFCGSCDIGVGHEAMQWVVLGTESGPGRRPANLEWTKDIVQQCKSAGVPVFMKQIEINGKTSKNPEDWPIELRVREIPLKKILFNKLNIKGGTEHE